MSRIGRVRARGEEGQLLLLVLVYTVIAGLLVTVVVDTSRAFLDRRALMGAADGAALAAANAPDLARIYAGTGDVLPLSEDGARRAVQRYARDAGLAGRFAGFEVVDVTTDGRTVTVTLAARVPMPVVNLVSARYRHGYPLDATARATTPLLR